MLRGAPQGHGGLSWIPTVLVLVVFAQVVKVIARWGRRLGGAWEPPGSGSTPPDPLLRSRRWY